MFKNRATIANSISFNGEGLHYGKKINVVLKPCNSGLGISFIRVDAESGKNVIEASYKNVTEYSFNTTVSNEFGLKVSTIEHFMAALFAFEITDLIIEIDGAEMPIMDGSSEYFCMMLGIAGKKIYTEEFYPVIYLKKPIAVGSDDSYIKATPCDRMIVNFEIDFPCKEIGRQKFSFDLSKDVFTSELAHAKTFGLLSDIEKMRSLGLAKGGDLNSAIIFDNEKIVNKFNLKYDNDFVRHKIIDFIGDIYIAGVFVVAEYNCYKSGHRLNNELVRAILA